MSNRSKIVRMYHIRYSADLLVPATGKVEALSLAEEELIGMIESGDYELGDIFKVVVENNKFHIVVELEEDDEDTEDVDDEEDSEDESDDDEEDDED